MFDSKKEYVQVGVTDAGYPIYMEKKEDTKMKDVSKKMKSGFKRAGKWIAAGIGAGLAVVGAVLVAAKKKPAEGNHGSEEATINAPVSEGMDRVIDIVPDQNGSEEDTSET